MLQNVLSQAVLIAILFAFTPPTLRAQWDVSSVAPSSSGLDDGMVIDANGNLYISQYQGTVVRRLTPDGTVSVYATGFATPNGLAVDAGGNLYVANAFGGRISRVAPDGTVSLDFISGIPNPSGLILNASGDTLYVSHYGTSQIGKVALADPTSWSSWVSSSPLSGPIGMAFDEAGNLHVGNFNDGRIFRISPSGALTEIASIQSSLGFLTLADGHLFATSYSKNQIYRVTLDGSSMDVIAGTGAAAQTDGPGSSAAFNGPNGIVATASGDTLYVSDFDSGKLRMLVNPTLTGVNTPDLPGATMDLRSHPNPFRTSATITYTLAEPSRVTIDVFNMLGQRVRRFAPPSQSIGTHQIVWDGRSDAGQDVPIGAYAYVVRAGGLSRSSILVRQH